MNGLPDYQVIRSKKRRRTLSLRIKEDGKIVICVPQRTAPQEIERFLDKSRAWVLRKMSEKERAVRETKRGFIPGEEFLYLGKPYPLSIEPNDNKAHPLRLSFGKFILDQKRVDEAGDLFAQWYKTEARDMLQQRVDDYSGRLLLFPKAITITGARTRWGSCSSDNRLSFSWRIIMAPVEVIDYILIHELVHIREKNHSKRFWSLLESIVPDYKECRIWLREHGSTLGLSLNR